MLREYAMTLMTAAVIGSVMKLMLPDRGSDGGIKKAVCWLISLVLLLAAVSPIKDIIESFHLPQSDYAALEEAQAQSQIYTDKIIAESLHTIQSSLIEALSLRYGTDDLQVELEIDDSDLSSIEITRVSIFLHRKEDYRKSADLGRYTADLFGTVCEVITEEGSEIYRFIV